jgi:hypothetical protein
MKHTVYYWKICKVEPWFSLNESDRLQYVICDMTWNNICLTFNAVEMICPLFFSSDCWSWEVIGIKSGSHVKGRHMNRNYPETSRMACEKKYFVNILLQEVWWWRGQQLCLQISKINYVIKQIFVNFWYTSNIDPNMLHVVLLYMNPCLWSFLEQ